MRFSKASFTFLVSPNYIILSAFAKAVIQEKNDALQTFINGMIPSSSNIIVNKKVHPLIFDYDLKFAVFDNNNIGEFGSREGNIKRAHLILHGVAVYFKSDCSIVRTENW